MDSAELGPDLLLVSSCKSMPPTSTDRPPDPKRFDRVEELVRSGHPDRVVLAKVAKEFGCHVNTARADLKRLMVEMREEDADKAEHRRDVMRFKLEALSAEVLEEARIQADPKARAINYKTVESIYGRLVQLDGVAESDRLKAKLLEQKYNGELSEAQLDAAICAEVERMSVEQLTALIERRKNA